MTHTIVADTEASPGQAAAATGADAPDGVSGSVLVGVDGAAGGRDAIALAQRLRRRSARLTLAHVVLAQGPINRNFHSTPVGQDSNQMLEHEAAAAGVTADVTGMFATSVGRGLHQLAEDEDAELLVVGACHRGAAGRLLRGDATLGSLYGAACPVAIAPPGYADPLTPIQAIGVAYDGSPESETALDAARALAARYGAAISALTVINPRGVRTVTRRAPRPVAHRQRAARAGLDVPGGEAREVRCGRPAEELIAFSNEVDLLVAGSRRHGPLPRLLLGSTTGKLARRARCPVLVLPRGSRPRQPDQA